MTEAKKHNIIKKVLISILTLGIFLLPISPSLELNNNKNLSLKINKNSAYAVDYEKNFVPKPTIALSGEPAANSVNLNIIINVKDAGALNTGKNLATAEITGVSPQGQPLIKVITGGIGYTKNPNITLGGGACTVIGTTSAKFDEDGAITEITASGWTCSSNPTTVVIESSSNMYDTYGDYSSLEGNGIDPSQGFFVNIKNNTKNTETSLSFLDIGVKLDILKTQNVLNITLGSTYITPETEYTITLRAEEGNSNNTFLYPMEKFKTPAAGATPPPPVNTGGTVTASGETPLKLDCGVTNLPGCMAQIFYGIFQIAAFIGKLAAWFLDFFVYYSTDSTSYTSGFVEKGWAAIRDISNIFFIIALLYISIKTILGLNVSNNKKLIGTIVIVALIINFSLFTTRVIIDATNILAKIFYNNITIENQDGTTSATGEKSISVALISKFNPQQLVSQKLYDEDGGTSMFIFITLLATAIVLYAAYVFFAVGLLFVSRVVTLWISMIFSPIAFASYTLPFDIPGFGHKEWWSELLKNAFLAPIFIFFLYIIVMFTDFLKEIVTFPEGASFMQKVMAIVIPYIILMVLLIKAKEMAIKFSGEMGKAIQKAGAMVGGLALGAATGGLAMAGRATIGRAGSALANSARVKKWESEGKFGAATLRNVGKTAGKGSFDARGVKIMGKDLASTGMSVGKSKEGGFEKARSDKMEKRQKRAKELEVGPDEELAKKVRAAEIDVDNAKSDPVNNKNIADTTSEIAKQEKELEAENRKVATAERGVVDAERAITDAEKALKDAIDTSGSATSAAANAARATRDAKIADRNTSIGTRDSAIAVRDTKQQSVLDEKDKLKGFESTIKTAEKALVQAQNLKTAENKKRGGAYATHIASDSNKVINFIVSGGVHSSAGADESADKIRARSASENTQKK